MWTKKLHQGMPSIYWGGVVGVLLSVLGKAFHETVKYKLSILVLKVIFWIVLPVFQSTNTNCSQL